MGSPYSVSTQVNRVHVVKTFQGFLRILKIVKSSMNCENFDEFGPEWRTLDEITQACNSARASCSRTVVSIEARYEWRGHEKFARVIIFDFSRCKQMSLVLNAGEQSTAVTVEWILFPYNFEQISQLI